MLVVEDAPEAGVAGDLADADDESEVVEAAVDDESAELPFVEVEEDESVDELDDFDDPPRLSVL